MTQTLIIVAAQLAVLAAVILHSRWRVRKRLRTLPRRPARARDIPAGHPDEGYVLSISDGLIWTALMATEATAERRSGS
jgi:hypothetical protein